MSNVTLLRKDVKKYIDSADERVLKMVHAMLQADKDADFWDDLPMPVKADVEEALKQSARGDGKPHDEVMSKYKKWLTK